MIRAYKKLVRDGKLLRACQSLAFGSRTEDQIRFANEAINKGMSKKLKGSILLYPEKEPKKMSDEDKKDSQKR